MSDIKNIIERNERRKRLTSEGASADSKEFVEQVYELKEINRFLPSDFDSLITTIESLQTEYADERAAHNLHVTELLEAEKVIESQKEQIDQRDAEYLSLYQASNIYMKDAENLEKQVESLKAITELAVKGFQMLKAMSSKDDIPAALYNTASWYLDEIANLEIKR